MNPDRREGARWGAGLAVALAAHGLAVGGGWWWTQRSALVLEEGVMQAVMVELAPAPVAPPAPPSELPPGPPQVEQARSRPQPTPQPKLELPPEVEPEVEDPDRKEEEVQPPEQQAGPENDRSAAQTQAPPQVQADPDARYAAPQTVSGSRGQAVATWQGVLLGHLEQYRRYPRQAERQRQEGVSYVRFAVDRQGNVSRPRIGMGSGHRLLDEETLATLQRATPVPPPPPEIEGDPVEVMVPVSFHIRRR